MPGSLHSFPPLLFSTDKNITTTILRDSEKSFRKLKSRDWRPFNKGWNGVWSRCGWSSQQVSPRSACPPAQFALPFTLLVAAILGVFLFLEHTRPVPVLVPLCSFFLECFPSDHGLNIFFLVFSSESKVLYPVAPSLTTALNPCHPQASCCMVFSS